MSWVNKSGVDKDSILGNLVSAFKKDESNVKGLKGLLQRLIPGGKTGKVTRSGGGSGKAPSAEPSLESIKRKLVSDSDLMRGRSLSYGPEYVHEGDFEKIGNLMHLIKEGEYDTEEFPSHHNDLWMGSSLAQIYHPGKYPVDYDSKKARRGEDAWEGVTDPLKLVAMITDAMSVVDKDDPSHARQDKYGRSQLTGKSFGQTDIQDIVKLISEGGIPEYSEDRVVLETVLDKILKPRRRRK